MPAPESHPEPRTGAAFEELLSVMPRIAEAVNGFVSEENQRVALSALLRAVGLPDEPPVHSEPVEPGLSVVRSLDVSQAGEHDTEETAPGTQNGPAGTVRRRARKKPSPRPKDINFRPEGKQSLREFAAEKVPGTIFEKNVVAVFYLEEFLEVGAIETGHVLAAFIECGWPIPANPDNALSVTACRKKWLDTGDRKAIRLTFQGRNLIQHDLPRSAKNSA